MVIWPVWCFLAPVISTRRIAAQLPPKRDQESRWDRFCLLGGVIGAALIVFAGPFGSDRDGVAVRASGHSHRKETLAHAPIRTHARAASGPTGRQGPSSPRANCPSHRGRGWANREAGPVGPAAAGLPDRSPSRRLV